MPSSLPISICAAASSEGIGSLIIEVAERGCCSNLFIARHRIADPIYWMVVSGLMLPAHF